MLTSLACLGLVMPVSAGVMSALATSSTDSSSSCSSCHAVTAALVVNEYDDYQYDTNHPSSVKPDSPSASIFLMKSDSVLATPVILHVPLPIFGTATLGGSPVDIWQSNDSTIITVSTTEHLRPERAYCATSVLLDIPSEQARFFDRYQYRQVMASNDVFGKTIIGTSSSRTDDVGWSAIIASTSSTGRAEIIQI